MSHTAPLPPLEIKEDLQLDLLLFAVIPFGPRPVVTGHNVYVTSISERGSHALAHVVFAAPYSFNHGQVVDTVKRLMIPKVVEAIKASDTLRINAMGGVGLIHDFESRIDLMLHPIFDRHGQIA